MTFPVELLVTSTPLAPLRRRTYHINHIRYVVGLVGGGRVGCQLVRTASGRPKPAVSVEAGGGTRGNIQCGVSE